jgi:branched-chain amino acid transport system substrate-binding protein
VLCRCRRRFDAPATISGAGDTSKQLKEFSRFSSAGKLLSEKHWSETMSHISTISRICLGAVSAVILASGCNAILGLNKLSIGTEPVNDAPDSGGGCKTNVECTNEATSAAAAAGLDASVGADGTVPAVCLQSEHSCVNLLSDDCKTITGDYKNDRAIIIGSLFATQGTTAAQNIPRQQSATLAVEEINGINGNGGIPSSTVGVLRPLVMVSCNTASNLVGAATHLVSDLKVPAIVGPNTSQDTLDVSQKVTIQAGVVVISPTAVAASIAALQDNDLTWLMIPTDDQRAPLMIRDINSLETQLNAAGKTSVKLSIIFRNDALGVGTEVGLEALVINGKSLADASNAGSPGGNVHIDPYDPALTAVDSILTKEIAFAPDIVVLAGTAETVTKFLTPLEKGLQGSGAKPYYYFIDPSKGQDLLNAVTGNDELRVRVRGTGTLPNPASLPVFNTFNLDYLTRYGSQTTASGAGPSYDAAYAIAYALAATKDLPVTGANVAHGLRQLTGGAENVNTGSQNLQNAFSTLANGQAIKATGTNCDLEWDSKGVVTDGTIEVWCISSIGGTPAFQSSGLAFDTKTGITSGAYVQCPAK